MATNGVSSLSEAFGGKWPDSPLPIWTRLANAAQEYPEKLAVACLHQSPKLYGVQSPEYAVQGVDKHLQWSYSQLSSTAERLAAGLQAQGLSSGSSIITILRNGVEFPMAFWAAHKLACPFVPLSSRTLTNAVQTRHMLTVADVAAVIVEDLEAAAAFDHVWHAGARKVIKIVAGEASFDGWTSISELLEIGRRAQAVQNGENGTLHAREPEHSGESTSTVTILFTSGTTSLPKGCPHTNLTLNAFSKLLSIGGASPQDVFCSVLPNSHAMGYFFVLHFFINAGTVVYPSATYEAAAMAQALAAHRCTHATLVPTALHSLLEWIEPSGLLFPDLKDLCLAGSSITPQNIRSVIRDLGARGVSTGYGTTEGTPVWNAPVLDPEQLIRGDDVICGSAVPGQHVRICAPNSTQVLPRGQPGEVHESGPGMIAGYLGDNVGKDSFYVDGDKTWYKTGDSGVMWDDGRVSVVGRFKDMIIRGGENIAPAAIEVVLNQFPGVEAQVVGASDTFAGEVPLALVRTLPPGDNPEGQLQEAVRNHMGILHVPDEVITLGALGLDDYPRTISGKVQKAALRVIVAAYRKNRESKHDSATGSINGDAPNGHTNGDTNGTVRRDSGIIEDIDVEQTVLRVWWRATGIETSKLDRQTPTFNYADSITLMRVRAMYRKELGVTLTAVEMSQNADIQSHIDALERKVSQSQKQVVAQLPRFENARTLDELQVVLGPDNDAKTFKETASRALESQGFDFDQDVESVIQMSDFMDVLEREKFINTWNFAITIVADGSTVQELKTALTAALTNNSLWTSFYVHGDSGAPIYVTMKPQKKLYNRVLIENGSVASVAELEKVAVNYPHKEHSVFPGPLFHALLYDIEDTKSAGFVMYVHHIVHDASSMRLFFEDINRALLEPARPLTPHIPYQLWSDIYHSLRNSPRATMEVNWHVKRLANIHLHRKAVYPPAHVPRQAIQTTPDGIDHAFDAPALLNLKRHHSHITASVVLKAAMALINVTRTKHTHALINNYEAARSSFPFWPDTLRHLPGPNGSTLADLDASDVAGPTMNAVTNVISVDPAETALAFLTRLQEDQLALTAHAHVPWRRVIAALDALHPAEKAGDLFCDIHRAQFMTWVPGVLGTYERLRVAAMGIRAALGLVFVAGLGGPEATMYGISLRWDVANYSAEEVRRFVGDTERAVLWLLEEGNWGRGLGEFLGTVGEGVVGEVKGEEAKVGEVKGEEVKGEEVKVEEAKVEEAKVEGQLIQ
ncbi:acetyl-CoA synthetase-like protein [Karstenula rhodostoma CBS 690.94]|uniref:Acetyl-CoA synthetase-like protein n=1 Tax=Karstenula rhodostoma CBS 690.94 TaxID=1392251 RepID=A0A9P4UEE0_9PLEO|nr:acetyl-CoA synthetase-like protein [Karstenula rhodostoma CBS 690.94]